MAQIQRMLADDFYIDQREIGMIRAIRVLAVRSRDHRESQKSHYLFFRKIQMSVVMSIVMVADVSYGR